MSQEDFTAIEDYIRKNKDSYTREAITEYVVKQGYPRGLADVCWRNVLAESSAEKPVPAIPEKQSVPPGTVVYPATDPGCAILLIIMLVLFVGIVVVAGNCKGI